MASFRKFVVDATSTLDCYQVLPKANCVKVFILSRAAVTPKIILHVLVALTPAASRNAIMALLISSDPLAPASAQIKK